MRIVFIGCVRTSEALWDELNRLHGNMIGVATKEKFFYIHNEIEYNYRMKKLQAVICTAHMEKLPEFIRRKNANYDLYKEYFDGFGLV